jgi:glucan phosphoethanolaminetransferase (alkaline phosphatase superfamily)
MQPHRPYIGEDLPPELRGTSITGKLIDGQISKEEAWEAYLDTLRYVLDEVEILLENIDADNVVITADHGEGFGEYGSYGHDFGWPHPVEKKVPWAETRATDTGEYVVSENTKSNEDDSTSVEERLKNLGYIDE